MEPNPVLLVIHDLRRSRVCFKFIGGNLFLRLLAMSFMTFFPIMGLCMLNFGLII